MRRGKKFKLGVGLHIGPKIWELIMIFKKGVVWGLLMYS